MTATPRRRRGGPVAVGIVLGIVVGAAVAGVVASSGWPRSTTPHPPAALAACPPGEQLFANNQPPTDSRPVPVPGHPVRLRACRYLMFAVGGLPAFMLLSQTVVSDPTVVRHLQLEFNALRLAGRGRECPPNPDATHVIFQSSKPVTAVGCGVADGRTPHLMSVELGRELDALTPVLCTNPAAPFIGCKR